MLRRELRWRHPSAAAVRPYLVVVDPPARNLNTRLRQAPEPVLVQAFVAKLAVEALDVGILRGLAWLVEDVCLMNPMICSSVYLLLRIALPLDCADSLLPWYGWRVAGQIVQKK